MIKPTGQPESLRYVSIWAVWIGGELRDRLDLDDYESLDEQVDPIRAIETGSIVDQRQRRLHPRRKTSSDDLAGDPVQTVSGWKHAGRTAVRVPEATPIANESSPPPPR
jgi:hypothetical protein